MCSKRTHTRTAFSAVPRRTSTVATMHSRNDLRSGRCSACARSTTRSDSSASAQSASSTHPFALRYGSARTSSATPTSPPHAAVNETVELVRAARPRAGRAVHERGHAQAFRRDRGSARRAARGQSACRGAQALVSRLDRRALVGGARPGGGARAHARAERAAGTRRPPEPQEVRTRSRVAPIRICPTRCTSNGSTRRRCTQA